MQKLLYLLICLIPEGRSRFKQISVNLRFEVGLHADTLCSWQIFSVQILI